MSVRTDRVNLLININNNAAQSQLNDLRKRAADLRFEMDGLTKGTAEYAAKAKELQQVNAQMTALKQQIGLTVVNCFQSFELTWSLTTEMFYIICHKKL